MPRQTMRRNAICPRRIQSTVRRRFYCGRSQIPRPRSETVTNEVVRAYTTCTTNGSGTLNNVIGFNVASFTDWTNLSGLYDEARFVGGKVTMFTALSPANGDNQGPIFVVYDNDDSAALTSTGAAQAYVKKKVFQSGWTTPAPITFTFKAYATGGNSSLPWFDPTLSTTLTPGSIKFYAVGLSNTTTYLTILLDVYVQFRGRR